MAILVGRDTKLMTVGVTGKQGTFHTLQCRDYGTNVVGVGAPGHFVVKHLYDNQEQFIDPFSGGKLLSVPEVEELVTLFVIDFFVIFFFIETTR